jgi:excisionase family DNA binding protein
LPQFHNERQTNMGTATEARGNGQTPLPIRRRLTEIEAAEILNVSPRTLQQWRVKGGGPPFLKLGSAVRYDPDALEAWTQTRTRTNTSDPGPAAA